MKPSLFLKLLVVWAAALIGAANALARDAMVVQLTGTAQVQLPGQAAFQPLIKGAAVPVGATIRTDAGSEVFLEVVHGVVATIKAGSRVLVEESNVVTQGGSVIADATLDLKEGEIVSTLNPRMKDQNRYKVRTPKGVAAARGTVYSVTFNLSSSSTTVATLSGTVTLDLGGGRTVVLPVGTASVGGSAAQAVAAALAQDPSLAQDIAEAVKIVADNVRASTSAVDSPAEAAATLAAVVGAASAAIPSQAASFVQTAISAAVSSSSSTGNTAANANGSTNAAVQAITEAAVQGAPGQTSAIVQQAAATVVEVKVTEAVAQARASGGDPNAAAANATANVKGTLDAVAQGAVNASGSGNAGAIASAVNSGAATGSANAAAATGTNPGTTPPVVTAPANPGTTSPITPVDASVISISGNED